jgi:hypothetical protein
MTINRSHLGDSYGSSVARMGDMRTALSVLKDDDYERNRTEFVVQDMGSVKYPFWDIFTLAQYLDMSPGAISEVELLAMHTYYKRFYIDKDTGKVSVYPVFKRARVIDAPSDILKTVQKRLATAFTCFPVHPANYAFLQNKGIVDALEELKTCETVIHVDLKDFFDNHTSVYINKQLAKLLYGAEGNLSGVRWDFITTIGSWVTLNRRLPQGAPTSPILSVVLNYEMDERVEAIASKFNVRYVRYADDIFLGGSISDINAIDILELLEDAVHPFRINHAKIGVMKDSVRPVVTGVKLRTEQKWLPPTQSSRILAEFRNILNDLELQMEVTSKEIVFNTRNLRSLTLQEARVLLDRLNVWIKNTYPNIVPNCKLQVYHLAKTKTVLGAHLYKQNIVFPRKEYKEMRLQAMLMGIQNAVRYMYYKFSKTQEALRSTYVQEAAKTIAKDCLDTVAGVRYGKQERRDLLTTPYSQRQYRGRVNWIRQIQASKANSLDAIELKYFTKIIRKILHRFSLVSGLEEAAFSNIIRTAVNSQYAKRINVE